MNIFIVHSGADVKRVNETKGEIAGKCKKANILLLKYRLLWKREVRKLMKSAQIVLYIVGADGHKSKNIDWEIKEAKKQGKALVALVNYSESDTAPVAEVTLELSRAGEYEIYTLDAAHDGTLTDTVTSSDGTLNLTLPLFTSLLIKEK